MKLIKLLTIIVTFFLISCFGHSGSSNFTLRVIHINDHHSHIEATKMNLKLDNITCEMEVGGFAKLYTLKETLKNNLKFENEAVLTLHAGDALQGTMYYSVYKGKSDAAVMNHMGFDAFVIGNHEFDDGDTNLADFISLLNFPVLSANIATDENSVLSDKFKPYIIKKIGENKIGIIGVTVVKKTVDSSNPGSDIFFRNELETVAATVKELENQGINKIILLSHIGFNNDLIMGQSIEGIDIIVGGDSHSLLGDFNFAGLSTVDKYPVIIKSKNNDPVCIVQAWEYAKALGFIDTVFDENGILTSCSGNLILPINDFDSKIDETGKKVELDDNEKYRINNFIKEHPQIKIVEDNEEMLETINIYKSEIEEQKNTVIGFAAENILHNRVPGTEYYGIKLPLGSELAPLICKAFYLENKNADLSIQNAGGVRQSIYKGSITMGDIYDILPFSNTLYEIRMTGDEIKSLLEDAIDISAVKAVSTGSFPYAYGIRYDIDLTESLGNRIYNLEIYDKNLKTWVNFDLNKMYTVITHSYLIKGKDGYNIFKRVADERGAVNTYIEYAESFLNFIKNKYDEGEELMKLPIDEFPIKSFKCN